MSGFRFHVPLRFFEKADAPEGQRRRIGGLVSTESRDRQDEIVLQRGLDFSKFVDHGYFNDNHSKKSSGVVGYPTSVKLVRKGAVLPDGRTAPTDAHWAEGVMLEGCGEADKLWNLGRALEKTDGARRLGYSIEGKVVRRSATDHRTVAKADVHHVAITHCPVNTDTGLCQLAKSLRGDRDYPIDESEEWVEAQGRDPEKMLTSTSGAALMPESLESDKKVTTYGAKKKKKKKDAKLTKAEVMAWFVKNVPGISYTTAGRLADSATALKKRGLL